MGSTADVLPAANAPTLTLALPTLDECRKVWTGHHQIWGGALSLEAYLAREAYLLTVPLAMHCGTTHWILTDATLPPNERPIYSSCETLRKPGMAATVSPTAGSSEPVIVNGIAHGIASVFTEPKYRGRGYAGRMLEDLGKKLQTWQVDSSAHVDTAATDPARKTLFSVLYSDIGKQYYARKGWAAFPSTHLSFPPAAASVQEEKKKTGYEVTPLGYHELTELCPIDVGLLRARLLRRAARLAKDTTRKHGPSVALVPDLDTMLWHLMREDYMTKHIFGKTPTVRGAQCSITSPDGTTRRSIWAIWTRGYYGGLKTIEGNTLYLLHIVLEDLDDDFPLDPDEVPVSQSHIDGFAQILRMAQAEAAAWHCGSVQMWNPTPAQRLLADRTGISYTEEHREKDSIPSLMWNRSSEDGVATETIDWVDNEKYAWY